MEIVLKVVKRFCSFFKIVLWKIIYLNKLKIGFKSIFYPRTHFTIDGGKVIIGKDCFFNNNCSINSRNKIEIGNHVIFGENICIYDHNHRFRDKNVLIKKQEFKDKTVKIGNNCWIGSNCTILAGTQIGDNCVIGAGCVVSGNIKENSIIKNTNNYIVEEY